MLDNNEEDLSKVLSYQIRIDNTEGIKNSIREDDKPVNRGIPEKRSLAHAIYNGCRKASLEALVDGGAEVAKGYNPQSDDLMLLLDSGYRLSSGLYAHSTNLQFKIDINKVKFLLDKEAKIVDDLSPLQDKIIASIHRRQIDQSFNKFNDFPAIFLEDFNSEPDYSRCKPMMDEVCKFQVKNIDDTFNLVKHFFVHHMHNEIKDESDRRSWQLHISTFKEKGRVIMLQYVFQKHPQDTTSDRLISYTYYTTLNHIFQRENLIYDIEGLIDSAQLIIKQKKGSIISNNIQSQDILINESGLYITDTTNMPSPKHTFSTAYKIATLAAHQIMHHDKKQSNKAKIADLIEEVIKCGVTREEIFESTNQFCRDYERKQYIREINRQDKLPNLEYHKLFEYIIECISYQAYKEGAVMGLFRNANTGSNPQEVNWRNLPPEIGAKISKHLSTKDACQVTKTCKSAHSTAQAAKKDAINVIMQQILDTPATKMEAQIENLNVSGPGRQ